MATNASLRKSEKNITTKNRSNPLTPAISEETKRESMAKPSLPSDTSSFWTRPSTVLVFLLRLSITILPYMIDLDLLLPKQWIYSQSWTFVLVRPAWTLSRVKEARAIQRLHSSPSSFASAYLANQSIRLPPLLLALLSFSIDATSHYELLLSIVLLLVDLLTAGMLEAIGRRLLLTTYDPQVNQEEMEQEQLPEAIRPPYAHIFPTLRETTESESSSSLSVSSPLIPMASLPPLAALFYFGSPFLALSGGIYHCFQTLPGLFLVASLHECVKVTSSDVLAAFYLAVATYLELYHVVYLVPLVLLWQRRHPAAADLNTRLILAFVVWFLSLHYLSYLLVGRNFGSVIQAVYGSGWRNIRPSLSLQWYFAMQLFARFRGYFSAIFLGLPYVVVAPLTIRFYKYPMVLVAVFSLLWTIFRPTQTLVDMHLGMCFALFCPRSLARMGKIAFFALWSMWVPVLLNVVDHWMWLEPNTGNPNYMFFQSLAYNVFLSMILGQLVSATLKRDKALRLAAKERIIGKEDVAGESKASAEEDERDS